MYYSHKKFLVQVERAESDGYLDYGETVQPYFKGNLIATDEHGNHSILPENYFQDHYIKVQKVEKKKSYNLDELASGYLEMGQLVKQSNENDEDYIFEPKKAF
jgi:hypothetical protein